MKQNALAGAVLSVFLMTAGSAQALGVYDFEWTGFNGYTVVGTFSGNDTGTISGLGSGSTSGLESLVVSFFDSTDTLLQVTQNVAGGVSSYDDLSFLFKNSSESFLGALTVGADGEPYDLFLTGNVSGALQLRNVKGSLVDFGSGLSVSSGELPTMVEQPEPTTGLLLGLGLGLLGWSSRRR